MDCELYCYNSALVVMVSMEAAHKCMFKALLSLSKSLYCVFILLRGNTHLESSFNVTLLMLVFISI